MSKTMLAQTKPAHTNGRPGLARVAVVLAGGLLIVTAFQFALTFGAPLGAAAQGGANPGQLPDTLRIVTGLCAVMWLVAALLVPARGGYALVNAAEPTGPSRRSGPPRRPDVSAPVRSAGRAEESGSLSGSPPSRARRPSITRSR